jgi:hypothetical protein
MSSGPCWTTKRDSVSKNPKPERGIKENDGRVNSTMIYCKNLGKCYSVPPVQQLKKKNNQTEVP